MAETRTWIVNTPLILGGQLRRYGERVQLADDQATGLPAGVISLADPTEDEQAQIEEANAAIQAEREAYQPEALREAQAQSESGFDHLATPAVEADE